MSRTPLFGLLKDISNLAARSSRINSSDPLGVFEELRAQRMSRRAILKSFAATGALLGATSIFPGCVPTRRKLRNLSDSPRVAIVGGGLAGLMAAYTLQKSGVNSAIYEASARSGGRCYTGLNVVGDGLTTELGGEFIDSSHEDMFALCKEFGLELYDVRGPGEKELLEAFWFGGQLHSEYQLIQAFMPLTKRLRQDREKIAAPGGDTSEFFKTLDRMPLSEYLARLGARGWFKDLISVAYVTEFGLELDQQSALNLVNLISPDVEDGQFHPYGSSDERYKVKGGNQRVADALAAEVSDQLVLGHLLENVAESGSGYRLSFKTAGGAREVDADVVILAIPFSLLRDVKLPASLPPEKRRAIDEIGYGTNAKFFMGFNSRIWRDNRLSGSFFTDEAYQTGWDSSRMQPGTNGSLTVYLGGRLGVELAGKDLQEYARGILPQADAFFPGLEESYNGRAQKFHWPSFPFCRGSYAAYKPGQWTDISGFEAKPVGNLFFAGEHCSVDFQGFMNGAVETGRLAAEEILSRSGTATTKAA